ncbi:DUF624 domain-containing protein [Plantactinospora siamensis]|uniref:DUF624 domain-containing protein n=1 Tax=Plantactinospora siamensis TaxID=555372 RepID=A0ABV6NRW3_9ACTN
MISGARGQFGVGPLARGAALAYTLLTVQALLLVTAAPLLAWPLLVPPLLLDRDASTIALVAACAVPLGPALSAALYALRRRSLDLTDLHPARAFWRGYRANWAQVLTIWVPLLLGLAIVAVNLAHFSAAAVPGWWAALLVVLALVATLGGVNALVIVSLFAFRTRDVVRLALYFLVRAPRVTLGVAAVLVVAAGIAATASIAVLAVFGSLLGLALLWASGPLIDAVTKEFTA